MARESREDRQCDICGRSQHRLADQALPARPVLERDQDGLWVCGSCRSKLRLPPVEGGDASNLDERLAPLIGKSAGAICRTLNLPYEPPFHVIIDAASAIGYDQDRYMSGWLFVTQWQDGTTLWQPAAGGSTATVTPDGRIRVVRS